MRTLDDETAWGTVRKELRYTLAVLRAAEKRASEVAPKQPSMPPAPR